MHLQNKIHFSEQWWCTEYAEEIHDVLRRREYDRYGFEYKAPQIQWRMHIIQYMLDIAIEMKLARTTLHLGEFDMDFLVVVLFSSQFVFFLPFSHILFGHIHGQSFGALLAFLFGGVDCIASGCKN